jgi:hypothetical protein
MPIGRMSACLLLVATLALAGCSSASPTGSTTQVSSASVVSSAPVGARVSPSVVPPPPMLARPETAVYSYMLWISYEYRTLKSGAASGTFDPGEGVRIDSYVLKNRQDERAIEQSPTSLVVKSVKATESSATVVALESWAYRYIDIKTGNYSTPVYQVSYDSTYTLVRRGPDWVVSSVQAKAKGPVK